MIAGYRIGWMVLSGNQRCMSDFIMGINMLSNMRPVLQRAGSVDRSDGTRWPSVR